jgi:hypothetical protein
MFLIQIVHSIETGGKEGLPYDLIAIVLLNRLPLFYLLTIDDNIFKIKPLNSI